MKTILWAWFKDFVLVAVLVALILIVAKPSIVYGESMLPTLENLQLVLSQRFTLWQQAPKAGDIVIVKTDRPWIFGLKKNFIKRVIAVPGDTLYISDYRVYLNHQMLKEPYILDGVTPNEYNDTIPEDHFFVMGDNRRNSEDSRIMGPVHRSQIIGKVYLRLWPFTFWGF